MTITTTRRARLIDVELPDFGMPDEEPLLPPSIYTDRLERLRERMEARSWSLDREVAAEAGAALPAELVHRFGLAGTADACRARLERLLESFPQISQVAIVPFAPRGGAVLGTLTRFIEEVALEPVAWT